MNLSKNLYYIINLSKNFIKISPFFNIIKKNVVLLKYKKNTCHTYHTYDTYYA